MKKTAMDYEGIICLLNRQLNHFWEFETSELFRTAVGAALERFYRSKSAQRSYRAQQQRQIDPYHSVQWSVFLYYLSNTLAGMSKPDIAAKVYYLNKIMHGVDWFYEIELPDHFWAEHPMGGVLGRASYGDFFFVYQGTTVGGNRTGGIQHYPVLGDRVLMYANSTVLGDTHIADNVIISANTYIKDAHIPECSIVFGQSPNLVIKRKTRQEIEKAMSHIWQENKGFGEDVPQNGRDGIYEDCNSRPGVDGETENTSDTAI